MRLARALSVAGRTLITVGVLLLLFVAYQLWGTGIYSARAQDRLERDFDRQLAEAEQRPSTTTATTAPGSTSTSAVTLPPSTVPPLAELPAEGEALGRIEIPKIGLDWIVVQGVRVRDLKKGPGHYSETPLPGQAGNAAIAGHRTTYGAPFGSVDKLDVGDEVVVTTLQGRFRYLVSSQEVVRPNQVEVLADKGDNRLTLTSCHPKYSARQRIVVTAMLAGEPVPASPTTTQPSGGEAEPVLGLSGEHAPKLPAVLWGAVCVAVWVIAWLVGRRWRKWVVYGAALPVFAVTLFVFFENFSRLLPSNY